MLARRHPRVDVERVGIVHNRAVEEEVLDGPLARKRLYMVAQVKSTHGGHNNPIVCVYEALGASHGRCVRGATHLRRFSRHHSGKISADDALLAMRTVCVVL